MSPSDTRSGEFTVIMRSLESGDPRAAERMLGLVYSELRVLSAAKLSHEAAGNTFQPTSLVHEAWNRLGGSEQPRWANRAHFFGAASEAMRRILVESARRKKRLKHGGGLRRVSLTEAGLSAPRGDENILRMNEALTKLAAHDPAGAKLIELRFFAGLSNVEAALALGLAERTAKRVWAYSRAWLQKELESGD